MEEETKALEFPPSSVAMAVRGAIWRKREEVIEVMVLKWGVILRGNLSGGECGGIRGRMEGLEGKEIGEKLRIERRW